jgi:hypothetical protein
MLHRFMLKFKEPGVDRKVGIFGAAPRRYNVGN